MTYEHLDISDSFTWEEGLPRPQWELLDNWVETRVDPAGWENAWHEIASQWLEKLKPALGPSYRIEESECFLLLAPQPEPAPAPLLHFADKCRKTVLGVLPGVADFPFAGKQVVIVLDDKDDYYRYLSAYYPEGHHGGSAGIQIREGYPHIAVCGTKLAQIERVLAHEMIHASLCHLALPLWVEEGLAQMFEHDMTTCASLVMNEEMAQRHKKYWGKHGLDCFWRGEGFSQPGRMQELSYQLAEILMRLLLVEYRPRWFGRDKEPQRRFFAFLRDADAADCGGESAANNLGLALHRIAAWFLGPGEWSPGL